MDLHPIPEPYVVESYSSVFAECRIVRERAKIPSLNLQGTNGTQIGRLFMHSPYLQARPKAHIPQFEKRLFGY
jgi:hypothetical protein